MFGYDSYRTCKPVALAKLMKKQESKKELNDESQTYWLFQQIIVKVTGPHPVRA
ncbi:hypothetical protein YC2023_023212 [Brassica napus]